MKHVSILVPNGHSSLSNIEGTHQILTQVNSFLTAKGKDPLFKIQLVGLSKEPLQGSSIATIKPEVLVSDVTRTDLIVIPAIHGNFAEVLEANKAALPWIMGQYGRGADIASFCIGAFLLAATGLLDGKAAATHWMSAGAFRALYPAVNLVDDKIMTEADGIYTSGGAYSYLNLLLYLVEKYAGRDIAILAAKTFMIDIDRASQSPFMIFQGQKAHEDAPVLQAQAFIEQHFAEKITVDNLAGMLALGRRSLERRFKHATSNTVVEYIQRVKIEAAKKHFESDRKNVNEVMYEVGYSDNKAFRTVFKKITGLSPIEYRRKYNKEAAAA